MENNFEWAGHEWQSGQRWGEIHPDFPEQWYDKDMISINDEGHLVFDISHKPKEWDIKGEKVISPVSIGIANCKTNFKYGIFEIEAKFPKGKELWPAFWLWSFGNDDDEHYRYAEIDGIEAYTEKKGNYLQWNAKRPWGWWRLETNFHYMVDPSAGWDTRSSRGARTGFMGFKNPSKHFLKYRIEWNHDKIEVFYNGYRVRKVTDEKTLFRFRNMGMNLILGNGTTAEVNLDTINEEGSTPFIVKSFTYTPF